MIQYLLLLFPALWFSDDKLYSREAVEGADGSSGPLPLEPCTQAVLLLYTHNTNKPPSDQTNHSQHKKNSNLSNNE